MAEAGQRVSRRGLVRAVEGFLLAVKAERDLSTNTQAAYGTDLDQFVEWARQHEIADLKAQLTPASVASNGSA